MEELRGEIKGLEATIEELERKMENKSETQQELGEVHFWPFGSPLGIVISCLSSLQFLPSSKSSHLFLL